MTMTTDDDEVEALLRRVRPAQDRVDAASVLARVRKRLVGADTKLPRVGRFEIVARLGAGGMGVVYEAHDPRLARKVALKIIPGVSEADGERVLAEARALAQLNHPHVVVVYEAEVVDGQLLIAMELVRGATLTRWNDASRTTREIVRAFVDAGEGLAAAHRAGLIHGDFKPDNVLVGNDGRVRVADFGLARQRDLAAASHERGGTPSYASPEQLAGHGATEASDQFAFGKALGRMLGDERARGLTNAWLRRIIARATSPVPAARYARMGDVVAALRAGLARRTQLFLAASLLGALVLGAGTVLGVYGRSATSCARHASEFSRTWNHELAAELRAGFSATRLPFASTVAEHVVARLDALGSEWQGAARAACEAARVDGNKAMLDVRAACIEDRHRALGALVTAWTQHPDVTAVTRAIDALGDVPSIPDCADPSRTDVADREPADPGRRAEWRGLRGRLASAREAVALGRTEVPEIAAIEAEARSRSFAPLVAEALDLKAKLAYQREDDDAGKSARAALALAAEVGDLPAVARDEILLLEMYIDSDREQDRQAATDLDTLVSAAATLARRPELDIRFGAAKSRLSAQQGKYDRARKEVAAALSLLTDLRAASHDPTQLIDVEAELRLELASMDQEQQRFAEGLAALDQAIAARKAIYGTALHPGLALFFNRKADLQRKVGDRKGALESARTALQLAEASAPHYADEAASAAEALSFVSSDAGNLQDGLDYAQLAVKRSVERYGANDPSVGRRKQRLAAALLAMHQLAAARTQIDESISISKKSHDDPARLADAVNTLGGILAQTDDLAGAEKAYRESLSLAEAAGGRDDPKVAIALSNIGDLAIEQHHFAEASEACRRALAIDTKSLGATHPDLAFDLTCLGKAYVGAGDARAAREVFERAWKLRTDNLVPLGDRADTAFALARVLDDHARAKKLATDAEKWFREDHKDKESAEVRAWLARR